MKIRILLLSLCIASGAFSALRAEVKPASMFGPDMVLQRGEPLRVWGTATRNEKVEVSFNGQKAKAKAGRDGRWSVTLGAMPAGGPYTMTIKGKENTVEYPGVLVGEVWLCSGQSNMEWVVRNSDNAAREIAAADYPQIRCFTVQKAIATEPQDEFYGSWAVCSPETVGNFTAVGYFFARKLWEELGVPVGIINSSWGGTDIEVWTSAGSFEALPDEVRRGYDPDAVANLREAYSSVGQQRRREYQQAFDNDPGLAAKWFEDKTDTSGWEVMPNPQDWATTKLSSDDGHVWFRFEFDLPESAAGLSGELSMGPIDDYDITWINGVKVAEGEGYNKPRHYSVAKNILCGGRNVITVRVTDTGGSGGLQGDPGLYFLKTGGKTYSLAGDWLYKGSVVSTDYGVHQMNPNVYNSTLYNGMINPMVDFRIRGAIWYQGENNAWNAHSYRTLFPNMIRDWRSKWGYDFSFYWVQLADYMPEDMVPAESQWAELREAQTMTLSLPATGQAVIIDIGDAADIHPRNKQDVGLRLALNALAKDYGRTDVVYSGPAFASAEFDGNRAIVSFDTFGSQLVVRSKYGYVQGFAVAGADRVFHWARAWIEDGRVIVESDAVAEPVAVRYAWSNNPQANLFNSEGLPVGPFRSDDWPGISR